MEEISIFLREHWIEIIGIFLSYFGVILPIIKFLRSKRSEFRQNSFTNYHRTIEILVKPQNNDQMFLDQQIAAAFELRNFPDYYDVTERILKGLRKVWLQKEANQRLIDEIDYTLNFISNKNINICFALKNRLNKIYFPIKRRLYNCIKK